MSERIELDTRSIVLVGIVVGLMFEAALDVDIGVKDLRLELLETVSEAFLRVGIRDFYLGLARFFDTEVFRAD